MVRLAFEHPDGLVRLGVVCIDCRDTFAQTPANWRSWEHPVTGAICQLCKRSEGELDLD